MNTVCDRLDLAKETLGNFPFCVVEWMAGDGSWEWSQDSDTGEIVISTHILGNPEASCRVLAAIHALSAMRHRQDRVGVLPDLTTPDADLSQAG